MEVLNRLDGAGGGRFIAAFIAQRRDETLLGARSDHERYGRRSVFKRIKLNGITIDKKREKAQGRGPFHLGKERPTIA
ncbi:MULTISPECIES: hypothetical protein [Bradyrhizobium]|uniref:hypothetical protein n=1 Tax=Bradyrhizobium TaxID=374 RepID=UPI00293E659D|nr:hypothetical protein [Bradyrhizobium sp. BWC-3-1]WOH57283.1 hypothetical protein RX329_34420 [Bradyrhizobium sp. BWC-3-1]